MAFPNISDILATTIESRTKKIADSVTDNNALLKKLSSKGKIKTFTGGSKILQELSFAENSNAGWYSGYDLLPVGVSDVLSAAEFDIKQAAVPVVISGLGIDRATWTFWRSKVNSLDLTSSTIQAAMNGMWASLIRGSDMPDMILMDNDTWETYTASLQAQQRFHQAEVGDLGFPTLKFMGTDVVLDGGIGGNATAKTIYFLNTKYLHYRPHAQRNMVALSPNRRYSTNQDAEVQILAWAGNLTSSGAQFQGRLIDTV